MNEGRLSYGTIRGSTFTQHYPFTGGGGNVQNCISNLVVERGSHRVYFTNLVLNASGPPQVWRTGPWAAGTPIWVSWPAEGP